MEHALHVVEGALAVFGTMKFCHEVFELVHHLLKLKIVVRLLR
jgi:hypothetical protein